MAGARQIVDPPRFTPTPYGLLSVVDFPTGADVHWQNGVEYQPVCSDASTTFDECIAVTGTGGAPSPTPWSAAVSISPRIATPFTVVSEFDCAAVGNESAAAVARQAFLGDEGLQVENSFWTGLSGGQTVVFPHLAANAQILEPTLSTGGSILLQTSATVVTGVGDAMNPATALGLLEGALASCYNGVGIIHIPQHAAASFDAWGLLKKNGPMLQTLAGNKVAIGAGYPGTSPAGVARTSDKTWVYATGNIMGYRTDVKIRANPTESFNKQKNTLKMIAERTYLLGWDCCHFAANVSLGVPKGT